MSESPVKAGTAPLPTFKEVAANLQALQSSLGAYVQCDSRGDEQGKAGHSARVTGAFRKILSTYQALSAESQRDLLGPIRALHETIVTLGIPLGPLRIQPPPPPEPVADPSESP
jgi:hypothetical protein